MSRVRTVFLLLTAAVCSVAWTACGSGNTSEDPRAVLDSATLNGVESGDLTASLDVSAGGGEEIVLRLDGPFQGHGEGTLPEIDMTAKADGSIGGESFDFEGGAVLLSDMGFINYRGTAYEIDQATFASLAPAVMQILSGSAEGGSAGDSPCRQVADRLGLTASGLVSNVRGYGTAEVAGTGTTKVSVDIDVSEAVDALVRLTDDHDCQEQLDALGPHRLTAELRAFQDDVKRSIEVLHASVYVGDDDVVRRISGRMRIDRAGEAGIGAVRPVEVVFDATIARVNEGQAISPPATGARPVVDLFRDLGVTPDQLFDRLAEVDIEELLERVGG